MGDYLAYQYAQRALINELLHGQNADLLNDLSVLELKDLIMHMVLLMKQKS